MRSESTGRNDEQLQLRTRNFQFGSPWLTKRPGSEGLVWIVLGRPHIISKRHDGAPVIVACA